MSLKGKVETLLEYEIRDKEGRIIKKGKIKGKSWKKNFARLLRVVFGESETLRNTEGSGVTILRDHLVDATVLAPEGNDSYGILVGTGGTPPTGDDDSDVYNLANKIPHGDADNKLHHYDTTFVEISFDGSYVYLKYTRDFKNNGSVDINIQEVALVEQITPDTTADYFLLFHTTLGSAVTVPAGATITWRVILKYAP